MSDRLDRIESALEENTKAIDRNIQAIDEVRKITESNAKAILALANQGSEVSIKLDRLSDTIDRLANIVLRVYNRQDDYEDRIIRLRQE